MARLVREVLVLGSRAVMKTCQASWRRRLPPTLHVWPGPLVALLGASSGPFPTPLVRTGTTMRQHQRQLCTFHVLSTPRTQELLVILIGDANGSDTDDTIMFALDGTNCEIDRNAIHAPPFGRHATRTWRPPPAAPIGLSTAAVIAQPADGQHGAPTSTRRPSAPRHTNTESRSSAQDGSLRRSSNR